MPAPIPDYDCLPDAHSQEMGLSEESEWKASSNVERHAGFIEPEPGVDIKLEDLFTEDDEYEMADNSNLRAADEKVENNSPPPM